MERIKRFVMNKEGIGFFKAILESYEDVGLFSVLDGKMGKIEVIYPIHFEKDMESIMKDMARYGIVFQEDEHV
ncbi:MAG: hypothetical protein C0392_03360 [Syntrophus sp. (in: bacteria)]|nr:hypothetical protein [Syntrophus sp. (in: bacteria)]